MRSIPLTQGKVAIVDDDDYEEISRHKWHYAKVGYAARRDASLGVIVYMHRVIMDTPKGITTDHVNHDKLDNRRENLRIATQAENCCNKQMDCRNKTGFKGVDWFKQTRRWRARVKVHRKVHHIGYFSTKEEAARAYDKVAPQLHGEFALTNAAMGRLTV